MRRSALACGWGTRGMSARLIVLASSMTLFPALVTAQSATEASAIPRTPWGVPDLQGVWSVRTFTPLERDEKFTDKAVLPPEEAAKYAAERYAVIDGVLDLTLEAFFSPGEYQPGELTHGRTSLIVDPPDGQIPARTSAGQTRLETLASFERGADGPEDRGPQERCLMGYSVPFVAGPFDQLVQIFQAPGYVAILHEGLEGLRLIPLNDGARARESMRQWGGHSRGRWEGNTLVVETTHFNGKWSFQGAGPNMRLVERFTVTAAHTLEYEFIVDDPESFASAWTVTFPFTRADGPLYEVTCHEGNYSMPLILSGARAQEREEAANSLDHEPKRR